MNIEREQKELCQKYLTEYWPLDLNSRLGVSVNFFSRGLPLNGLRHPPEGDTNGWYLWAGEVLSQADDFFQPLHAKHLMEKCPEVLRYLGLLPGWRFLIANECEYVWYDEELLRI